MKKLKTLRSHIEPIDLRRGSQIEVERIRGYELTKIRKRISKRDEYACQICGRAIATDHGEVDHKIPLYLGGAESDENRWWLCPECHKKKSEHEEKERG